MKNSDVFKTILIGILIIGLAIIITSAKIDNDKKQVYKWAGQHNMEVKSIELHMTQFHTPFFWLNKGSHIYEVNMTNGEKWWCRTGFFSNDWEKDK